MIGKRFFLIAGGTVGGLGAVLSITPPQFGSASGLALGTGGSLSGGTTSTPAAITPPVTAPAATPTPTDTASSTPATPPATPPATTHKTIPKATHTATPKATHTAAPKSTHKATPKTTPKTTSTAPPVSTPSATPTPSSTPKASGVSGTYTGASANTIYGPVQVQITLVGGKITNAIALTYPTSSFRDQQINQQAIPYLIQETLAAQSANIQGVGGASYTSQGWYTSLVSALAKAGL